MHKKSLIIVSLSIFVLSSFFGYVISGNTKTSDSFTNLFTRLPPSPTPLPTEPPEPKTEECPLNGEMYGKSKAAKWTDRRPLAVVIENHKESRPQSGIASADVVYEGVSEGGVTRTLSLFYCQDAKTVGPVRSARVHFINLLREWGNNPLYAHVGGANCDQTTGSGCGNGAPADALGLIRQLGWNIYNDMNQFSVPYPVYYRDYERIPDVATEHTVYSSTQKLWDYARKNRDLSATDEAGIRWDEDWKPWTFQDDAPPLQRGKITVVAYDFYDSNTKDYSVRWEYDTKTNIYKRFNGGAPHLDMNNEQQLTAKNVIVILAPESPAYDDYPGGHVIYDLTAGGTAYIFQNGKAIEGTWAKDTNDAKMQFFDSKGNEISIVRGPVWISLLPSDNIVKYGDATKIPQKKVASPVADDTEMVDDAVAEDTSMTDSTNQ